MGAPEPPENRDHCREGCQPSEASVAALQRKTYHVLVRVHEDVEPIFFGYAKDVDRVLDPFLVVDAGAPCLDGLPGEDIADGVVAESF